VPFGGNLMTMPVSVMQQGAPHTPSSLIQTNGRTVRRTYNCGGRPIPGGQDGNDVVAQVLESASHNDPGLSSPAG